MSSAPIRSRVMGSTPVIRRRMRRRITDRVWATDLKH
jgi:hypothetical protein